MSACVYTSTKINKKVDIPKYNASFFPCHDEKTTTVYLNGSFPQIEELCKAEGLECLPLSKYKKPKTENSNKDNSNG